MTIFRGAVERFRGPLAATIESPAVPLTSGTLIELVGGHRAIAGPVVTVESSMGLSAVWRATNLISGTCAGLPLKVYRDGALTDVREPVHSGWAADLLAKPHPDMTPFELWELCYVALLLWGNAYFLKVKNGLGVVTELWWINPGRIKPGRADDGTKVYVLDGKTGVHELLGDSKILHIPGFGYDGISGKSIIGMARNGFGLALAAEEYGSRFYSNGSLATGILQSDQRIDQPTAKRLKDLWKLGGTGLESAHDIRVMGDGAKFTQLSIPNEDAQFLETREFQITDVARWFGVPPHLLMQTDKQTSWGTGIESQNLGLVTFTLTPYLQRVEQRLTQMITPGPLYARYALEGLLRGTPKDRADFYTKMFALGALSPNDIRRHEDLPPVPDGDKYYRPLNYAELGADPVAAPAPAPEPAPAPAVPAGE